MKNLVTNIYSHSSDLPEMPYLNYFHSKALFELCEQTPRQKPYMVVVSTSEGRILCHLLAVIRYRSSWFPPYLYMHCRIHGTGEYEESEYRQDELFGLMLQMLNKKMLLRVLYTEFGNLGNKMFGYKQFRQNGYFPVHWMSIHNSLHNKAPEERLSDKMKHRIANAEKRGVISSIVETDEDFHSFSRLMHMHNVLKPKRYIPDEAFFKGLQKSGHGQLFLTKYRDHVVGCCACAFSGKNAYLWYSAFRRKSFHTLHPDVMTIWNAIKYAYQQHYDHIVFMDVGLPFRKNPFREFILRFGGKPVSTNRWFHINISWFNSLFSFFYRE